MKIADIIKLMDGDDDCKIILSMTNPNNDLNNLLPNYPPDVVNLDEYSELFPIIFKALSLELKHLSYTIQLAKVFTFRLIIAFGNFKNAINYLERFEKSNPTIIQQPVHDACMFTVPDTKDWDITLWRGLIEKIKPIIPKIFSYESCHWHLNQKSTTLRITTIAIY